MTRRDDHYLADVGGDGVVQGNCADLVDHHIVLVYRSDGDILHSLHLLVQEYDLHRRRGVDFVGAKAGVDLVVYVRLETLHNLGHQVLGLELKDLVGDAGPVDEVVVAVQTCRAGGVGRVLDDDGGISPVHQGRCGISVSREASADEDSEDKPVPVAEEIEEKVDQIDAFFLFCVLVLCHID